MLTGYPKDVSLIGLKMSTPLWSSRPIFRSELAIRVANLSDSDSDSGLALTPGECYCRISTLLVRVLTAVRWPVVRNQFDPLNGTACKNT